MSNIPTWKTGLVALLDCLGTRALSKEATTRFLRALKSDLRATKDDASINDPAPIVHHFADNIAVTWPLPMKLQTLYFFCELLQRILARGIKSGLLWRGSFAFGEYCILPKGVGVLGPAMAEAAEDYERADWFGIIASRQIALRIDALRLRHQVSQLHEVLIHTGVPMKQASGLSWDRRYCINWAQTYCSSSDQASSGEARFLEEVATHRFPGQTIVKVENARSLFTSHADELVRILQGITPGQISSQDTETLSDSADGFAQGL